jgi:type 1 fimbria pilin
MTGQSKLGVLVFLLAVVFIGSTKSFAYFTCYSDSASTTEASATYTVMVDAAVLNKSISDAVLSDMSTYARCTGYPTSAWKDGLRVSSFSYDSSLTDAGFEAYLQYQNGAKNAPPAANVCLWPDASCSATYTSTTVALDRPIYAKLGVKRITASDRWRAGSTIPAGTQIARLVTQMRQSGNWSSAYVTWLFVLKSDMITPAYTCSITQYDKSVTLPAVKRSDIVSNGTGRYPNAKKEFTFDLACEPKTAVSVTFDGDILSGTGTDSVLKNKLSGNDNVGIQLLFNDNTPVKMSEKLQLVTSAQATQLLSFNAYYYYKGGAISGGPVKANATFTFDYQ